ncbi:AMP-binding enzyme domain-containing protein [Ditylenchus destructor]|uniref:long-chain-fatty-acid--CoA ligase n=1 Tax=Ditylenchus destructor TaxID=166010 RepID=A0AAD4NDP5_9BILA|nr:AMP-binding enzyme domain-containing protein [Ditylenchus destructor]
MPDRKDSYDDSKRIEQELSETQRPIYVVALAAFLKVFFIIYDAIVFIPFKIFADPEKKLELSQRIKGRPVTENDPSSPWRHVDTIGKELWTDLFDGCDTLGKIWDEAAKRHSDIYCMGTRQVINVFEERQKNGRTFQKLVLGEYEWLDYTEVDEMISEVCKGLQTIGIKKGQHIAIYAETRVEWIVSAIACFKCGFPVVTVYPTLGDEAVAFAMKECDAVAVFAARNLLPNIINAIKDCPTIKDVIYFSELHQKPGESKVALEEIEQSFNSHGRHLHSFDSVMEMGTNGDLEPLNVQTKSTDLAVIMYTSGTTGNPKGVLLSHRNIIAAISGQSAVISVDESDTYIGYLPLAHILEICAELVCLSKGCRIGYSSAQTLFDRAPKIQKGAKGDCGELKPTLIACVPAIMDRIFKAVSDEVKEKSAIQRELFRICYERKRARYEEGYSSLVMNRLAFDRIRKLLGGHLRFVLSGGAPLNAETQRFMNICFCCPVVQDHDLSTGSVGPPLRCCEIMLREWSEAGYSPSNETPQGEILIHGDNVAIGYYKNEEKTKEDFISINGKRWFATGDIGEFRADGSLCIIDRKKDLIKLAHGEYISLGRVETTLLTNPNVDNICVYGNSQRDFLVALVVPNQKNLEMLAEKNGVTGKKWEDLCRDSTLCKVLQKELADYVTGKLNRPEIPQKVFICHEPWTPASGLLTEALKLKRKNIEKAFEKEIKIMYK